MKVIGLISGTSVDGIDAALVEVTGATDDLAVDFIAGTTYPYPEELRSKILSVCHGAPLSMAEMAELDDAVALTFAQAALALQVGHPKAELIGSHGQTVYHRPPLKATSSRQQIELGYSLQWGRGELIAHLTGIPTVSNFRAADIAVGGQGAPLVPAVDLYLLRHPVYNRCVQNIGGIGNVAYLPAIEQSGNEKGGRKVLGWDTGPGNSLLDLAVQKFSGGEKTFDQDGAWAAQGTPCQPLVQHWLQQDFFQQLPPKSTGRELFGAEYIDRCCQEAAIYQLNEADLLATLTELTAVSIAHSYRLFLPQLPDQVLLCGGGSRNLYLKQRLQANLESVWVGTTDEAGVSAEFKEAIAFAVLAYWRTQNIPGNLPEATGAQKAVLLGEIHLVA